MPLQRSQSTPAAPIVVIGAGPTGLSAAYHLGQDAVLLEQAERVGGWCRSIEDGGFTFDMAGHIMFRTIPTSTRCIRCCWATTSIGRIGKRGSTARGCSPDI